MPDASGEEQRPVLTRGAFERIKAEYEELTTEGRRAVAERLLRARELGDLSENAEYDETKNEQGLLEAKIRNLGYLVKTAVVQDGPVEADSVQPGVIVKLRDSDGDEDAYLFAHSKEEKASGARTITNASPLGAALQGKSVGEKATYEAPAGAFTVEVLEIKPWNGE